MDTQRFTPSPFPGAPRFRLPWRSVYAPVVPCTLDGTLSLLELIAKLEYVINQYSASIEANHTDILALAEELETSLNDLREYIDAQDAHTLDAAQVYADGLDAALRVYIDAQDADTLELAKDYAESLRDALRIYVDQQIGDLRTYVNAQLALKQDILTFDDLPTTGSTNPVTSNGIAAALTSVQGLIGILRDDLDTAIANTRYDWTITDSTSPVLPAGVTYTSINNAAIAGKVMRVTILDTGVICNYVGNGTYLGYSLGGTSLVIVDVTLNNTVRITTAAV